MNTGFGSQCVPNYRILTEGQIIEIHKATLQLLEDTGVRIMHPQGIQLLKDAGCRINGHGNIQIPSGLVESCIHSAPASITIYSRNAAEAMQLEENKVHFGLGTDLLKTYDLETGILRPSRLQDVVNAARIADYFEDIDFIASYAHPQDIPANLAYIESFRAELENSIKPIFFTAAGSEDLAIIIEMAEVVAGGEEAMRKKPMAACYINAISGLLHNKEALQKLLFLSSKNLPLLYLPSSTAAVTSPVTPAGNIALDYAGVLVGLVLSQLTREGTPVIVSGMPPGGTFDMRTMVTSYCEPERTVIQALAHFYDLPMFSIAGASEAKLPDQQAAAEAAMSLVVETLAGGNIIHDLGYLESGLTYSLAQLVLCDEIVSWIKAYTKQIEVSDETLALDVIERTGPVGQFLDTDHTLRHYRERWYPTLFERGNYKSWKESGEKSLTERASERIEKILKDHSPEPLPEKIKKELRKITLSAELNQK